jgi:hypothetical protein
VNEVSIVEAWTHWLSGDLPPTATFFGVSIFWWGRLGKIMQGIGAVTIVADIIGPEKIRSFGTSLHTAITPANLIYFLKDCFEWYSIIFRHTLMKDYTDETTPKGKFVQLNLLNYIICFLLMVVVILLTKLYLVGWFFLIEAVIIFGGLLVSLSPLVTVLAIMLLTVFGLVINWIFIKPLAWILEHPAFDRWVKIASLLFLLVGFHFELLAS